MTRRLPSFFDESSEPIERRLAVGLQKLGLAMKQHAWSQANEDGLSPTQGQIVATLALEGPLNGSELASRLGLTLPTISDSVRVLAEKKVVSKSRDPRHARATLVSLTARGRALAKHVSSWPDFLSAAVAELTEAEREVVLRAVVKMIRSLRQNGYIPTERMCVTCKYFRPRVHDGAMPHHCALVDAPMGDWHLRIECSEHEPAPDSERDEVWSRFVDD